MCAELQLVEVKRTWLVAVNMASAFVGLFGLANGLVKLSPLLMGLGMLAMCAGLLGAVVASD